MIPILYESNETVFTSNGLGRLYDAISVVVTEERNGIFEVDFDYPINGINFDEIKAGRIIACEHDETGDVQPFDIVSYSRPINGIVSFHGVHISYRLTKIITSGTNITTPAAALEKLAEGSPSNLFKYFTDKTSSSGFVAAFDGVPRSVRQILGGIEGSILDTYGGEYKFDKFNVNLLSSRGELRDFTIRYGVNLVDYQEDTDFSETFSSIVPYWTGTDDYGNQVVVKGGYTTLGETTYSGRDEAIPLDLTDKFENKPTAAQLENAARSMLSGGESLIPQQSITIDFVRLSDSPEYSDFAPLQTCSLCDSVQMVFPRYGISGTFKIVKTVYDVLLERYTSLELGTLSTSLSDALGISNSPQSFGTGDVRNLVEIAEKGTSNGWDYIKYTDGRFEATRVSTSGATGTLTQIGSSGIYYSNTYGYSLPSIGITKITDFDSSCSPPQNYLMQLGINRLSLTGMYVYFIRYGSGTAVSDITWTARVAGEWA